MHINIAENILQFWFDDHDHKDWFGGKPEFDDELKAAFWDTHPKVAAGEAWRWRKTAAGRLAEILVLDQFSRQFFRGEAKAFAFDNMALTLAQEMVHFGLDKEVETSRRSFIYMPYMHSESLDVHGEAKRIFAELGNENMSKFEDEHEQIIKRFGRFPKRNAALGRASTPEEIDYIAGRGDSFF